MDAYGTLATRLGEMELLNIGGLELLFLLAFAIIIFGPQRAMELASQIGRIVATIRRNLNVIQQDIKAQVEDDTRALRDVQESVRDLKTEITQSVNGALNEPDVKALQDGEATDSPSPSQQEEREG